MSVLQKVSTASAATAPPDRTAEQQMRDVMTRWGEPIYRHIRRMVVSHADAEDAVQETFIKVFRNLDKLRQPEALKAWLYRIATNEALRMLAERKRSESILATEFPTDANLPAADEYVDYTDLEAVRLQQAIHTLPPKQQAVFLLRYYDELSYEEIADATDMTASSAKVNYHFAKTKITEYISSHDT